jgi:hypothetical protein
MARPAAAARGYVILLKNVEIVVRRFCIVAPLTRHFTLFLLSLHDEAEHQQQTIIVRLRGFVRRGQRCAISFGTHFHDHAHSIKHIMLLASYSIVLRMFMNACSKLKRSGS